MSCWSAYPWSTMSRAHGCCCCTALQHEQTTSSAQCPQMPRLISLRPTMQVCGDVCAPFCNSIWRSQTPSVKLPQSRSRCEGLASAALRGVPAFWSSWAGCSGIIHKRHPDVAARLVHHLEGYTNTPSLQAAAGAARSFRGVQGFEPPSWEARAHGARPAPRQPDDFEPGCERVEELFRDGSLFSRLDDASKVLMRSQGGVGSGLALSTCPLCRVTRLEPCLFRVLLLRRLRLPLPLTGRNCRCGFQDILLEPLLLTRRERCTVVLLFSIAFLRPRQPCHGAQGMVNDGRSFRVGQIVRGRRPQSEKWPHAKQVGSGSKWNVPTGRWRSSHVHPGVSTTRAPDPDAAGCCKPTGDQVGSRVANWRANERRSRAQFRVSQRNSTGWRPLLQN